MGLLSRKRKQPRIVKKNKKLGQKKVSVKQLDPHIRVSPIIDPLIDNQYRDIGIKRRVYKRTSKT
jgi:hypothetical protein